MMILVLLNQLKILEIAQDCINNDKDLAVLKEKYDKKN